jgi:SAM-dependent methyltransferase
VPKLTTDGDPLIAEGFRDLDSRTNEGLRGCIECLRFIRSCPHFSRIRAIAHDYLNLIEGATVVDGGCGLGHDVRSLAEQVLATSLHGKPGRAIGVDISEMILDGARNLTGGLSPEVKDRIEFLRGDITKIKEIPELAPGIADAFYEERTLQHISPQDLIPTLEGIIYLLRPGGRAVFVEPQWSLLSVRSSFADTTRKILSHWQDSFNNGSIAFELAPALRKIGFQRVQTKLRSVEYDSFDKADFVFNFARTLESLVLSGELLPEAAERWLKEQKFYDSDYCCRLIMTITVAESPGYVGA